MAAKQKQISMRGLAEVASAAPARKLGKLKKFKFPESDESVGRSNYYVKALAGIRHHHKGDGAYVSAMIQDLASAASMEQDSRKRAKLAHNHRVISEYLKTFGSRALLIQPGKSLYYVRNDLVVSARPDLVVIENGELKLIKLNMGKGDFAGGVSSVLLHVLYQAAKLQGLPVQPNGVECLQVASGGKITGPKSGFGPKQILDAACDEIIDLWQAA